MKSMLTIGMTAILALAVDARSGADHATDRHRDYQFDEQSGRGRRHRHAPY